MQTLISKVKDDHIKNRLRAYANIQRDTFESVQEEIEEDMPLLKLSNCEGPSVLKAMKVNFNTLDPNSLDEIGSMKETKALINEFIVRPWDKKYRQEIKDGNVDMPNGFLMHGHPGCGKTCRQV
ncbi:MAG: hypothetical protein PHX18_08745 [Candidatus Gastranaerophilales bacterium]|nr:hypothetical protein [Candidatus Gastranaerophilales bacterium]